MHQDRRSDRRYPVALEVQYTRASGVKTMIGIGKTRDISRTAVSFGATQILPPGTPLEVRIAWPVPLQSSQLLTLVLVGPVVRMEGQIVVVRIAKSEFRTRGKLGTAPNH